MRVVWPITLMTHVIAVLSAFNIFAQDELIIVKNKGGVAKIKDKTKPPAERRGLRNRRK